MMRRMVWSTVAVTLAMGLAGVSPVAAATVASSLPAQGSTVDGVGWHISEYGYDQLHAQGIDGSGVTIAIAEQAFDPNSPDFVGADVTYVPLPDECAYMNEFVTPRQLSHGNSVAAAIVGQGGPGQIQGVAPGAKLIVYQLRTLNSTSPHWRKEGPCVDALPSSADRFLEAEAAGVDIMSLSALSSGEPNYVQTAFLMMREKAYFRGGGNEGP
ncbi:hypothetical protein EG850_09540 [Gulosibacter macacae]|uniref:Peptidase S8/S53 domain-containing protein n=1 Tax=Gulosibacter macacae TaxID=2488791 RepID=A0A3P3VZP4_9MICO|nr:S8 family serine peptidase [Gulosibacter macacae]RRJ86143.1 hypothetical protein EG850_09540 [Gulosibacter macacae]